MSRKTIGSSYLFVMIISTALYGCGITLESLRPPPKPTQSEYIDVDYQRFVSGVYVQELANKYVKVRCSYGFTMGGTLPGGYSPNHYLSFRGMTPNIRRNFATPEMLTVVLPKDLADIVFGLKHGDELVVYGRAVPAVITYGGWKSYSSLILEADRIEKI